MPFDIHTTEIPDNCNITFYDKVIIGTQLAIPNAAGSGAGASVTTAVSFPSGLPSNYFVVVQPSQNCFDVVTSKTSTGFNVVLTPVTTGTTLAAGTFDIAVIA